MATVITNAVVTVGGVDLSSHVKKVTLTTSTGEVETTTFGNTAKRRMSSLKDSKISLDFLQSFDAAAVEATIAPLVGSTAAITVKPQGSTTAGTNPAYSFNALISEWSPLDASVGELAAANVTWPIDGTIAKATA